MSARWRCCDIIFSEAHQRRACLLFQSTHAGTWRQEAFPPPFPANVTLANTQSHAKANEVLNRRYDSAIRDIHAGVVEEIILQLMAIPGFALWQKKREQPGARARKLYSFNGPSDRLSAAAPPFSTPRFLSKGMHCWRPWWLETQYLVGLGGYRRESWCTQSDGLGPRRNNYSPISHQQQGCI
jgi:hypothetical protein